MPAVVVVLILAVFGAFMFLGYRKAVRDWEISCDEIGINVRRRPAAELPARPVLNQIKYPHGVLAQDLFEPGVLAVDVADWRYVRDLEWTLFQRFYHTVGGAPIPDDSPDGLVKEQAVRTPLAPYYASVEYASYAFSVGGGGTGQTATTPHPPKPVERRAEIIADGIIDEDGLTPARIADMTMREYTTFARGIFG